MNEQIQKFAEQSRVSVIDPKWMGIDPEKFVELIVQEIHQVLGAEVIEFELDDNFGAIQGVGRSLRKIKKHFGVE